MPIVTVQAFLPPYTSSQAFMAIDHTTHTGTTDTGRMPVCLVPTPQAASTFPTAREAVPITWDDWLTQ